MEVRFNLVSPTAVIGALKATGSTDRDVLFAAKEEFAARYRPMRWFGIWGLVTGGLMTVLVLTAFLGIPLMVLGWWWLRRARRNITTIETTYATYTGDVAATVPTAGVAPIRAIGVVLLALLAQAGAVGAQDAVPDDQAGEWVPAKGGCDAPTRLILAGGQPYIVYVNANEKKGQTTVEISDASLKQRFPLEKLVLKRCPAS